MQGEKDKQYLKVTVSLCNSTLTDEQIKACESVTKNDKNQENCKWREIKEQINGFARISEFKSEDPWDATKTLWVNIQEGKVNEGYLSSFGRQIWINNEKKGYQRIDIGYFSRDKGSLQIFEFVTLNGKGVRT